MHFKFKFIKHYAKVHSVINQITCQILPCLTSILQFQYSWGSHPSRFIKSFDRIFSKVSWWIIPNFSWFSSFIYYWIWILLWSSLKKFPNRVGPGSIVFKDFHVSRQSISCIHKQVESRTVVNNDFIQLKRNRNTYINKSKLNEVNKWSK